MQTGHPLPPVQYQQTNDATYTAYAAPSAVPAPPIQANAPDFVSALHAWTEQNQEMLTHLAENVRVLTEIHEALLKK